MKHKTIVAPHEMVVPQKKANHLKSLLLGSNTALSSGIKQPHAMAPRKYCLRKINHSEIPAIQITGTNVAPELRKRKLIRRPGDVCAEIVYEK